MKVTTKKFFKAVRDLHEKNLPITSLALRDALGIKDTEKSTALDIASGWISNLRRWGILRAARNQKVKGPSRWLQVYKLTAWGEKYRFGRKKAPLKLAANPDKETS